MCREILERNKLARLLEPNSSLSYHVDVIIIIVNKYINNIIVFVVYDFFFCLAAFVLFCLRNVTNVLVFLHYSDTQISQTEETLRGRTDRSFLVRVDSRCAHEPGVSRSGFRIRKHPVGRIWG